MGQVLHGSAATTEWTCSGLMESGLVGEAPLELDRAGVAQR
jgi:hypothetical protein